MTVLHEQAVIPVADPRAYETVRAAIEDAFSARRINDFFKSLERAGLRIRNFESILEKGKLGAAAAEGYRSLGNGDQGMIREFYLATLEKVPADLRAKFLKLYAYY